MSWLFVSLRPEMRYTRCQSGDFLNEPLMRTHRALSLRECRRAIRGDLVCSRSLFPVIDYRLVWIKPAIRSATIITAGLMGARTKSGMIDASTTRNLSIPRTSPY